MRSVSKPRKKSKVSNNSFIVPFFLVFLGSLLFVYGGMNYFWARALSFSAIPVPVVDNSQVETVDRTPVRIAISSLNIDLSVERGKIENGVWEISYENATFLETSAKPGQGGNVVIYGHNKTKIFGNLPSIAKDSIIELTTSGGETYRYKVVGKFYVKPDRVDLVSPTSEEVLTLYTCWGTLDSQRVVIKAEPVIDQPS